MSFPFAQEEFVKWKGSLFFQFVSTLIDSHPDVARYIFPRVQAALMGLAFLRSFVKIG